MGDVGTEGIASRYGKARQNKALAQRWLDSGDRRGIGEYAGWRMCGGGARQEFDRNPTTRLWTSIGYRGQLTADE